MREKVVVGMSGGVDSSVAAYLLKEQGYDVIGVTMQMWRETDSDRALEQSAIEDAKRIAERLSIPHHTLDFSKQFYNDVVCPFMNDYRVGRTPNPCVLCNERLKWAALLDAAKEFGAEHIATGHYARIVSLPNGHLSVQNAKSASKDQTYALYRLSQEMLSHTLMPVGDYEKEEVRKFAEKIDLQISEKKDSQEICFIPDKDYGAFLERQLKDKLPPKGHFVTKDGVILGEHEGISHYTIGQRKGLNIAMGHPIYVTKIDSRNQTVTLGENEELFSTRATAHDIHFMGISEISSPISVLAKVRYGHKGTIGIAKMLDRDTLEVTFSEPVRAITPGQSLVLYQDGAIVCGGILE